MNRDYLSGATGTAPTVPASPSNGYPTNGNPATGTPATTPGAYWFHMVTEELMALVSAAGLTAAAGTLTQLRDALYALFGRLGVAQTWTKAQRGAVVALADSATITPDFSLANNFSVTLGGNRTLAAPSNLVAGQSGVISITQDGTGSRTLAFNAAWKFAGGTAPSLTTTAGAVDELVYYVRPGGSTVFAARNKDVK